MAAKVLVIALYYDALVDHSHGVELVLNLFIVKVLLSFL